ncbi:cytochrome c oxidase subunit 7A1, mitochondrial-like [Rhinophrynus dorsalis]
MRPHYLIGWQRQIRNISSSRRGLIQNRVIEKQKIFQADNDLPVHLKGGTGDAILYRITMGISITGTCISLFQLFKAAQPKKGK